MVRQQLKVLDALDVARPQCYHFNVFLVTGLGFFAATYNLFSISFVTRLLGRVYYQVEGSVRPGTLPRNVTEALNAVALCGTLSDLIIFGCLGDKFGRRKAYAIALVFMTVFSLASGLWFGSRTKGVMAALCFFRFWLGVGVGGVYPLSATIMSEYANTRLRGRYVAAVFAMQGAGILASGIVALIVATAFDEAFKGPRYLDDPTHSTVPQADYVWRIILMVGAFPAAFAFFWLIKVLETARYSALVARNAKQAAADMSRLLHTDIEADEERVTKLAETPTFRYGFFSKEFLKQHGHHLFATTSTWFLFDIAIYSQNLFQVHLLSSTRWLPPSSRMNAIQEVQMIAKAQIYIALCATIPGLILSVKLIDFLGRLGIQLIGFLFMTIFMFGLALSYNHWASNPNNGPLFLVLYSLTFFFANFGPNVTTFVLAAEIFPARLRSTCHGVSAAAGKAGAIVGAFGFFYAAQPSDPRRTSAGFPTGIGVRRTLIVLAFVNLLGLLITYCTFRFWLPEPKGKSLEELTGENKGFGEADQEQQQTTSV